MAVLFNGKTLITPAVETSIDDSAMHPVANPAGNVLALIGEALGGIPKKPIRLRSPMHARQVLRGGPLYEAALRAFAPSAATGSPAHILAVRVDPATQSTATLKDATGQDVIVLRSTDYGAHTRTMEVRLEAGSKTGYRVSVRQDGTVYSRDNLGAEVLTVQYAGDEDTAQVSVLAGELVLEAPMGTVVRRYTLSDWSTAAALAESINGIPDWHVSVTRGKERFQPRRFDKLAASSALSPLTLTGHAFTLMEYFRSAQELFLDAVLQMDPAPAPAMMGWTPMTGGSNGNVVGTDWEDALATLHEVEAHWLVPLSDEPAIWDMVANHCMLLSSNKRERRAFVGANTGVTAEEAQAHAIGINNPRVAYIWPGVYQQNLATGKPELLPAYMAAVNMAAAFASMNPGETMSRKTISVYGAEVMMREPTDTDALIESGVCALVQSSRGTFVSQAVSTWQTDDRYDLREVSVGAAADYVARAVRANLEMFLGTRGAPLSLASIRSRLESILNDLAVPPPLGPGILVGDGSSPAYKIVSIELDGDVVRVNLLVSPVIPINYVLVGISLTPYSGASN